MLKAVLYWADAGSTSPKTRGRFTSDAHHAHDRRYFCHVSREVLQETLCVVASVSLFIKKPERLSSVASSAQGSMHSDIERPRLVASDPLMQVVKVLPKSQHSMIRMMYY